jgi:hypothetical protein
VCRGNRRSDIAIVSLLDQLSDGTAKSHTNLRGNYVKLQHTIAKVEKPSRHDVQFRTGQLMHFGDFHARYS